MVNHLKPLLYTRVYFSVSGKIYWESRNYISLAVIQPYERNLNQAAINICNLNLLVFTNICTFFVIKILHKVTYVTICAPTCFNPKGSSSGS